MDKKKIHQDIEGIEYIPLIYPIQGHIYMGTLNKRQINQIWVFKRMEYDLKRRAVSSAVVVIKIKVDNQNVTGNEEFKHKTRIIKLEKIDYKGNLITVSYQKY